MFEFYDMYTIRIYTAKKKKSWSLEILIQKAPLPLVRNHSVSYGRFKRRLVDSVQYLMERKSSKRRLNRP